MHREVETKLNFSTTYHPQIDGQIEGVNQILEDMLRMYCMNNKKKWEDYFHLVEFAYNNAFQSSTKMAPFEALYGQKCRTPISWNNVEDRIVVENELLVEMEEQTRDIQKTLKAIADRQKSYADQGRTPRDFTVGDKVFLCVKLGKSSIKSSKLATRFVGPFEILQKVNPVAYKLDLPLKLSKMHNVFHVSLLKKYINDPTHVWNVDS